MPHPSEARLNQETTEFLSTVHNTACGWQWLVAIEPGVRRAYNYATEYPQALTKRRVDDFVKPWLSSANLYFAVNLTLSPENRGNANMAVATMVYSDLDSCDPKLLKLRPSILIESSPNRYQGLWLLEKPTTTQVAAELSRRIAYFHKNDGADTSGWDEAQILRLPGTYNYNRLDSEGNPARVKIIEMSPAKYRPKDFEIYPETSYKPAFHYINVTDNSKDSLRYKDLSVEEQYRVESYVERAVTYELTKLIELGMLEEGEEYAYEKRNGQTEYFGWGKGCSWVAKGLIELANAPWNDFSLDEAYTEYFETAPRDANFTDYDVEKRWRSALKNVSLKDVPFRKYPRNLEEE